MPLHPGARARPAQQPRLQGRRTHWCHSEERTSTLSPDPSREHREVTRQKCSYRGARDGQQPNPRLYAGTPQDRPCRPHAWLCPALRPRPPISPGRAGVPTPCPSEKVAPTAGEPTPGSTWKEGPAAQPPGHRGTSSWGHQAAHCSRPRDVTARPADGFLCEHPRGISAGWSSLLHEGPVAEGARTCPPASGACRRQSASGPQTAGRATVGWGACHPS